VETFDLHAMSTREPGAHIGATFQILRRRANVQRCFLVLGATAAVPTGGEQVLAIVFEEVDVADGRRWWMAARAYHTDEATGLGHFHGEWEQPPHDTNNPASLPSKLLEMAAPPPGARPADIREASATWMPDMKFQFGDLPPHAPLPADAKEMVELTAALGAVNELLEGQIMGTVVVRIASRSWEKWVLTDDMPAGLTEMVRWIASHRLPPADGVAIAQIAVRPQDDPPVPGMQVVGERAGMFVQTWAPITFPEGPAGKKVIPTIHWWPARPVEPAHQWLGVPPKIVLIEPEAIG
jgi:hypothetical protein